MEDTQSSSEPILNVDSPKKGSVFPVVILIGLVILAVFGVKMIGAKGDDLNKKTTELTPAQKAIPTPTLVTTPYTLADISSHSKPTDCWFAMEGNVYDVTKFIAGGKHPGGEAILQGCGKDATTLFNTRPMGSGTPHSDKARGYLANFQIGILSQ